MQIKTKFDIAEKVRIDEDGSITGTILALCIRGEGNNITYEVAYFHNGAQVSVWVEEWRLST